MRDQNEGYPDIALQGLKLDLHFASELAVQGCERLVEQQHGRSADQGAGKDDPLTARELPNAPFAVFSELDQFQCFVDPFLYFRFRWPGGKLTQAVSNVVGDIHVREQGVVLKHHVYGTFVGRHADHRDAADQNVPLGRLLEARDQTQRRRLSTPGRPEKTEKFALLDRQAQTVDGDDLAIRLGDTLELDIRRLCSRGMSHDPFANLPSEPCPPFLVVGDGLFSIRTVQGTAAGVYIPQDI